MDAIPIKWALLIIYYFCIVLWGSEGSPYGAKLIDSADVAITVGQVGAGVIFLLLPFMERSVFYFSSRMLLAASSLRVTAGCFFYLLFALDQATLRQFLLSPTTVDPKPGTFYGLWIAIVGAIFSSFFLRYLKRRQKRFIHLDG